MKRKIFSILFALVLVLSLSLIPATLVGANSYPELAALWHLDEGSGATTVSDSSGTTPPNDGTIYGATSGVSGKFGNALSFDGTNDYVEVAHDASLEPSEITIEAWIYPLSWDHTPTAVALATKRTAYGNGYFLFWYASTSTINFDWGGSSGANRWNTGYNPPLNTWTHLAVTRSSAGRALYVNGAISSSTTHVGAPSNVPTTSALRVGYDSFAARYPFKGSIDEVRIWNGALTPTQIALSYSGSIKWLPPVTNADFELKDGTTLPLKFQLLDNGTPVTEVQSSVSLEVTTGPEDFIPIIFQLGDGVENLRWNEEGSYYIANLKTKVGTWPKGLYTATVGGIVTGDIEFDLSAEKGVGRGNSGK